LRYALADSMLVRFAGLLLRLARHHESYVIFCEHLDRRALGLRDIRHRFDRCKCWTGRRTVCAAPQWCERSPCAAPVLSPTSISISRADGRCTDLVIMPGVDGMTAWMLR
jgi:hypothetical protein